MSDQLSMNVGKPDEKPTAMVKQIDGTWYVCFGSNSPYYGYFKANNGRTRLDYSGDDVEKIIPKVRRDFPGHTICTEIKRKF